MIEDLKTIFSMEQQKIRAAITAVEAYLPDYILTNEELSKMVDTNDEWIRTRVGIEQRHILKGDQPTSFMAIEACKILMEKHHVDPKTIDGIILSTVTPDMVFPATASIVADALGVVDAISFDMSVGCAGFLNAFEVAANFIETGKYKRMLVISAEKMSAILDYTDRNTCPLFGDGAGVAMLEACTDGNGLQDEILRTDGSGKVHLHMKAGGSLNPASEETVKNKMHYVYQEGRPVFKAAVSKMADVSVEMIKRHNLDPNKIWYLPHQANLRIIEACGKRMGMPRERILVNINDHGNTSDATIPILLSDYKHTFKKGDDLVLSSFGAGFAWGALYIKWAVDDMK